MCYFLVSFTATYENIIYIFSDLYIHFCLFTANESFRDYPGFCER